MTELIVQEKLPLSPLCPTAVPRSRQSMGRSSDLQAGPPSGSASAISTPALHAVQSSG